jgi:hypothetical protein
MGDHGVRSRGAAEMAYKIICTYAGQPRSALNPFCYPRAALLITHETLNCGSDPYGSFEKELDKRDSLPTRFAVSGEYLGVVRNRVEHETADSKAKRGEDKRPPPEGTLATT